MTNPHLHQPEFVIALRGWDRQLVESYVGRLRVAGAQEQRRGRTPNWRRGASASDVIERTRAASARARVARGRRRPRASTIV